MLPVVPGWHGGRRLGSTCRGYIKILQVGSAESHTGDLLGRDGYPSLHCAIGIVTDNLRAVPLRRPKKALGVDYQAIGKSFAQRDLDEHAAILDSTGYAVVVIGVDPSARRVSEIQLPEVDGKGQPVGEMNTVIDHAHRAIGVYAKEMAQRIICIRPIKERSREEPPFRIRHAIV